MQESSDSFVGLCSFEEARENQVDQLAMSACGATAVLNTLSLLKIINDQKILLSLDYSSCILRKRANDAPLPQYLRSRYDAGCTGEELVTSFYRILHSNQLSSDDYDAEFVPYASIELEYKSSIIDFLVDQLEKKYVVIATLNLQIIGNDAWHHQIIYGVNTTQRLIYTMNPLECYPEELFSQFLSTKSILLIREQDILSRVHIPFVDNSIYQDPQWKPFDVEKQIQNIIDRTQPLPFVMIPAAYQGGFAIFRKKQ